MRERRRGQRVVRLQPPDHDSVAAETVSYVQNDQTQQDVTVFTRRGDRRSHGWLDVYDTISQHT